MNTMARGAVPEAEWTKNSDAPVCMICSSKWTYFNRRHHCRHCGRIVCQPCSPDTKEFGGEAEAQRVCVDCHRMLTRKERAKAESQYKLEKEIALLESTSYISDKLLRVYFLDTSFKTVSYDEYTTCADIATKICYSVRVALFEVDENLKNEDEYSLVPSHELIHNVVKRWENAGKPRAKLVIPLYDVHSSLRQAQLPSMAVSGEFSTTAAARRRSSGRMDGGMAEAAAVATRESAGGRLGAIREDHHGGAGMVDAETHAALQKELEDIRKKWETLKTVYSKANRDRSKFSVKVDAEAIREHVRRAEARKSINMDTGGLAGLLVNEAQRGGAQRRASTGMSVADPVLRDRSNTSGSLTSISEEIEVHEPFSGSNGDGGNSSQQWPDGADESAIMAAASSPERVPADMGPDTPDTPYNFRQRVGSRDAPVRLLSPSSVDSGSAVITVLDDTAPQPQAKAQRRTSTMVNTEVDSDEDTLPAGSRVSLGARESMSSSNVGDLDDDDTGADDSAILGDGGGPADPDMSSLVLGDEEGNESHVEDQEPGAPLHGIPVNPRDDAQTRMAWCTIHGGVKYRRSHLRPWKERMFVLSPAGYLPGVGIVGEEGMEGVPEEEVRTAYQHATLAIYSSALSRQPYYVHSFDAVRGVKAGRSNIIISHGKREKLYIWTEQSSQRADWFDKIDLELQSTLRNDMPVVLKEMLARHAATQSLSLKAMVRKLKADSAAAVGGRGGGGGGGGGGVSVDSTGGDGGEDTLGTLGTLGTDGGGGGGGRLPSIELKDEESAHTKLDKERRRSIETILNGTLGDQASEFVKFASETEEFFGLFNELILQTLVSVSFDPQETHHLYETITTMQTLYGFLISIGENWSEELRAWLLRMLKTHMRMPVERPDLLTAIIQCLTRDNHLYASETVAVVNDVIKESFDAAAEGMREAEGGGDDGGGGGELSTESVLRSVRSMIVTLDQVIEVMVPLLPPDLNVVTMWQDAGHSRTSKVVEKFYEANKETLKNEDMLVLLSFADQQQVVLKDMGMDTKAMDTLGANMLKQYKHVTVREMRKWMMNIFAHERDAGSKTELVKGCTSHAGVLSLWPEDLMASMWGQMDLCVSQLRSAAKIQICVLVLEQVPLFVNELHNYYEEKMAEAGLTIGAGRSRSGSNSKSQGTPDRKAKGIFGRSDSKDGKAKQSQLQDALYPRLCASVNNVRRFRKVLEEHWDVLAPRIQDIRGAVPVLQQLWEVTQDRFVDEGRWFMNGLVVLVRVDFVKEVQGSLFSADWFESKLLPQNLALTFSSYYDELKDMLFLEDDLKTLTMRTLCEVMKAYLELVLTTGVSVGQPRLVARLQEDVTALAQSFSELEGGGRPSDEEVQMALSPLQHVLACLTMDTGAMKAFIRNELAVDFGPHALLVWQTTMAIREEPKEMCDAIYGAITYPDARNVLGSDVGRPRVDVGPYKEALRGGRSKRKIVEGMAEGGGAKGNAGWNKLRAQVKK